MFLVKLKTFFFFFPARAYRFGCTVFAKQKGLIVAWQKGVCIFCVFCV